MKTQTAPRCVECGWFLGYEDNDARCKFTPDSDYSIETVEWTCGRCVRAAQQQRSADQENGE